MIRLYIALAFLAVLAGWGAWTYHAIGARAQLKLELKAAQHQNREHVERIGELEHDRQALNQLLANRDRRRNAAAAAQEKARHEIEALPQHPDADVARWARDRVPDAVLERLCRAAPAACHQVDPRSGAGGADRRDKGPGPRAATDERGPGELGS